VIHIVFHAFTPQPTYRTVLLF